MNGGARDLSAGDLNERKLQDPGSRDLNGLLRDPGAGE